MTTTGTTTRTTCPYCGVGCGVLATREADGTVTIKGDPDHPANFGRLCSKGTALGETLGLEGRLLTPRINGAEAAWDEALDLVASTFASTIREHGPEAVAFYVSGQLLTEDYYVANKLMKGYIGTANIDTNSRLCMASTVAGHRRAFGSDTVPGCYEDLELADLVVLVGSNLAWCHPVLFQRLMAAKEKRGTRIVVIDPRRTITAERADMHLAITPDGDVALFAGLLAYLRHGGWVKPMMDSPPSGWLKNAMVDWSEVLEKTGLELDTLSSFFLEFAGTEKVVTLFSQGVNQSASGTDKVNAIINCHLATGRIGKPGMGPFSVTGQPNAMGGREVGGLANMLAAHMNIEDAAARERVQRFWRSPAIATRAGLKAVDLFRAVSSGKIKALWIMGTNPAASMPEADGIVAALKKCPFVVVSDVVESTDTTAHAHVLLPAAAWGEKDGTVTNSERRISRQRGFLPVPGGVRPDWAIIADVACRMGFAGFDYAGPAAVFAEHAALSGFENNGLRDFDISAYATVNQAEYDCLPPFQWPQKAGEPPRDSRFFGDGRYFTPDGMPRLIEFAVPSGKDEEDQGLFYLNTGRIRDQWHTMTRTGNVPRLMAQFGEPFCDIHPQDAESLGISSASLIEISRGDASAIVRARLTDRQNRGEVFVPMHWSGPFARTGRINAAVAAVTDPVSGQPALKMARVSLRPFAARWFGYCVSASPFPEQSIQALDYYAISKLDHGYGLEFALATDCAGWGAFARAMGTDSGACEWFGVEDAQGPSRFAAVRDERLAFAMFVDCKPVEVSRSFAAALLAQSMSGRNRLAILAGRGSKAAEDDGPIVCACRRVGKNRINAAIRAGCRTLDEVAAACAAGSECGSCRHEIKGLLDASSETARYSLSPG